MIASSEKAEDRKITDIFPYLVPDVLEVLGTAAQMARQKKLNQVNGATIFTVLQERGLLYSILDSLKVPEEKITEAGRRLKEDSFIRSPAFAGNKTWPGLVVFSLNVRKALLLSFLWANRENLGSRRFVSAGLPELVLGLLLLPDSSLESLNISLDKNFLGKITYLLQASREMVESAVFVGEAGLTKDLNLELSAKQIFDREEETQEVLRVLVRQKKNNILLVGDPGVGKKTVVLALLKKLKVSGGLNPLKGFSFLSLNLQSLSGQENLGKFLEFELKEKSPSVLFLENIEVFKTKEQVSIFTNFLYNLGSQVQSRFILSASPSFYNQFLQAEPLVSQNFELIKVSEITQSQMIAVLQAVAGSVEKFHQVVIETGIFEDLITLCQRYFKSQALPEAAISLLEEVASDASVSGKKIVAHDDLLKVISQKTGIPVASLTVSEKEKLMALEQELGRQVIGQSAAIKKVAEAIRRSRAGLKDPKKPIGSFLFLGPTGVGKTELAKALARTVFDSEKAFVRLDMSEYSEPHTAQRLIGAPPGYVGYEEGGQLTNPVLERPYSLILLDEIEKAHAKVFDIFLQVLDDGRLTDSQGRTVDFKNTIIIATSNIAQEELVEAGVSRQRLETSKEFFESKILPRLKEHFRPEFINRFEEIVIFNSLNKEDLKQIALLKLKDVEERLKSQKISLKVNETTLGKLVEDSFDPRFGARPLARKIREEVENQLAQKIIENNLKEGDTLEL